MTTATPCPIAASGTANELAERLQEVREPKIDLPPDQVAGLARGRVDVGVVGGGEAAGADDDRDAVLDRGDRDRLGVLVRGELDEHVDAAEGLADVAVDRDAERLAAQRRPEILAGAAARDRGPELDVGGRERAVDDGAPGPAGGPGDGEVDGRHGQIITAAGPPGTLSWTSAHL